MKKNICNFISVLFISFLFLFSVGCGTNSDFDLKDYKIKLVLVDPSGLEIEREITSSSGVTVSKLSAYREYPKAIDGYVVINDCWYTSAELNKAVVFPYTMPKKDVVFYSSVRPLTSFQNLKFADNSTVYSYFSENATLQNEYGLPVSEVDEDSFYEISDIGAAHIKRIMRYYPATQKIMLVRGVSITQNVIAAAYTRNTFTIGVSIDLSKQTIDCKGICERIIFSAKTGQTTGGWNVGLTYNVSEMSIDDTRTPLFPNMSTINYNYSINYNTDSYDKLRDYWSREGDNNALKCYEQVNELLSFMNTKILVLS